MLWLDKMWHLDPWRPLRKVGRHGFQHRLLSVLIGLTVIMASFFRCSSGGTSEHCCVERLHDAYGTSPGRPIAVFTFQADTDQ